MCSPRYLAGRDALDPAALVDESLLHLEDERWHWIDWPVWLRELGVTDRCARPALRVNSYPLLIQAAIDGHGIALGWQNLSDHLIANGSLVRASTATLDTGHGFYVVTPLDEPMHADVAELRRWLVKTFTQA